MKFNIPILDNICQNAEKNNHIFDQLSCENLETFLVMQNKPHDKYNIRYDEFMRLYNRNKISGQDKMSDIDSYERLYWSMRGKF